MCVIIARQPDVAIPAEMIEAACTNNPHGWGYIIPDRGKLEIRRFYDPNGNRPEDVIDLLDDAMELPVYLHMRWCTAGDKSKRNVHPFPVLFQRKHGQQVWLMHNGTMSKYKENDEYSDTYHFAQQFARPLMERFQAYTGKKKLLQDPMLEQLLEDQAGWHSILTFIDNYGNNLIVNKSKGKSYEGWWASNDYSFRDAYRTPKETSKKTTTYYPTGHYSSVEDYYEKKEKYYAEAFNPNNTTPEPDDAIPFGQAGAVSCSINGNANRALPAPTPPQEPEIEEPLELTPKTKFVELLGLQSLHEVKSLSEEDIYQWVVEYPEHTTILIRDLLEELDNGR